MVPEAYHGIVNETVKYPEPVGVSEAPSAPVFIVCITITHVPISLPVADSLALLSISVGGMSTPFQVLFPLTAMFVPEIVREPVI
jgi:hypothetical protein